MADNTHNLEPWVFARILHAESLSDGILVWPDAPSHLFINDADHWPIRGVRFVEKAPLNQRDSERSEVARRNSPPIKSAQLIRLQLGSFELYQTYLRASGQRQAIDHSS